jgi:sensor histidine kinase YesM
MMAVFGFLILFVINGSAQLDPTTLDIWFLIVAMLFVVLFVVAVKLLKTWYKRQQLMQDLTHQKLEAELKMLKSQIQPHFLFNSLNSIYSLSLSKSDLAPEMVLKLSEILDYLLYECDSPEVLLSKEINMVTNYIELQKVRFGDRVNVSIKKEISDETLLIAPMLLIPFVENVFKHGVSKSKDRIHIEMDISGDKNKVSFSLANDVPESDGTKSDRGGIGLANVKRRLDMLYPNRYKLDIQQIENRYHVSLEIDNQFSSDA